jgi:tRNA threonylcarbamoyladenosine modification (KEOPS) complex Cgi121 subunit
MITAGNDLLVQIIKEATIEMIKASAPAEDIFNAISKMFNNPEKGRTTARLVFIEIGLDIGMTKQVDRYISKF